METDMSDRCVTELDMMESERKVLRADVVRLTNALAAERAKVVGLEDDLGWRGVDVEQLKKENTSLRSKLDAAEAAKQSAEYQLEMEKAGREDDGNNAMMHIKKLSVALDAFRSKLPKTTDGVTVLPGMTLYGFQLTDLNQPKPIAVEGQVIKLFADGFRVDYQIRGFGTPEWYSTAQARDAAVAALSRQEGGQRD
jgi:regulator of replication initiation timing